MNLNDDGWTCKTASTVEEDMQLVEAGFQYVTDMDGLKIFKKTQIIPFFPYDALAQKLRFFAARTLLDRS